MAIASFLNSGVVDIVVNLIIEFLRHNLNYIFLIFKNEKNFFLTNLRLNKNVINWDCRYMHWISILFYRIPLFLLSPLLRNSNKQKRIESITNYKLLTLKKSTNLRSSNTWK